MDCRIIMSLLTAALGLYGLAMSKNIIKSIICLQIMESAIVLLYLSFADKKNGISPIHPGNLTNMVDPLPQALMITTIIIGSAISALALMISIKIYHHYETLNWQEIMEKDG